MSRRAERARWRQDFPAVIRNGDLGELEKFDEYRAAKSGDPEAALKLAQAVVRDEMLDELLQLADRMGGVAPTLAPVVAEEADGRNWIPLMASEVIAHRLGWEVETDIVQSTKVGRTGKGADYRLVHNPAFSGPVSDGKSYVILDDTLSMGGTLASLHGFIANRGGHVLGASAMTAHPGALQLPVSNKLLHRIDARHGPGMNALCEEVLGHSLEYLTQGEAGHFRSAESVEVMRSRLLAQGPGNRDARLAEVELLLEALGSQQAEEIKACTERGWQAYGRHDLSGLKQCLEEVSGWSAGKALPPLLAQQLVSAASALGMGDPQMDSEELAPAENGRRRDLQHNDPGRVGVVHPPGMT